MAQVTQKMKTTTSSPKVRELISSRMLDFLMAGVARLHTTIIIASRLSYGNIR